MAIRSIFVGVYLLKRTNCDQLQNDWATQLDVPDIVLCVAVIMLPTTVSITPSGKIEIRHNRRMDKRSIRKTSLCPSSFSDCLISHYYLPEFLALDHSWTFKRSNGAAPL